MESLLGQPFVNDPVSSIDRAVTVDNDWGGHRVKLLAEVRDSSWSVTTRAAEASSACWGVSAYLMSGIRSRIFSVAMVIGGDIGTAGLESLE